MIRKTLLLVFIYFMAAFAQSEYSETTNGVYQFIERMHVLGYVNNYNSFTIPLPRKVLAEKLYTINLNKSKLSVTDQQLLQRYLREFLFDFSENTSSISGLFNEENYSPVTDSSFNFLYFKSVEKKGSLFISGHLTYDRYTNANGSLNTVNFGGIVRGTLYQHFGYYLYGSNGFLSGNKQQSQYDGVLRSSFKLAEKPDESFFDDTRGYISFDYNDLYVKYGRDYLLVGPGKEKSLISGYAPLFDYFSLSFSFDRLSYNFFHGKLLGSSKINPDSIQGSITTIAEKYIASHRLQIRLGETTKLGLGEIIIYSNRSLDMSYCNPLIFFKSIEHGNRDRDNSMIYFDFSTVFSGIKPYVLFLMDDIDYSKLGTGWFGNEVLWNAGISVYSLNTLIPLDITLDYLEIQPYVFSHRINENNFTNFNYILGYPVQPNSRTVSLNMEYRVNSRLTVDVTGKYGVQGANEFDEDGKLVKNNGGDINTGHRVKDSEKIFLLDGPNTYFRRLDMLVTWNVFNNLKVKSQIVLGDYYFIAPYIKEDSILKFSIETQW